MNLRDMMRGRVQERITERFPEYEPPQPRQESPIEQISPRTSGADRVAKMAERRDVPSIPFEPGTPTQRRRQTKEQARQFDEQLQAQREMQETALSEQARQFDKEHGLAKERLDLQRKLSQRTADAKRGLGMDTSSVTGARGLETAYGTAADGDYADIINRYASEFGIPAPLIQAVIHQESGWNPQAKSHAGAMGLMQLMPGTAADLGVTNPYDPVQNIRGGVQYLRDMLDRFGGDVELALAAYNAGPNNVDKYGGIPPFQETQNYIPAIMNHLQRYK